MLQFKMEAHSLRTPLTTLLISSGLTWHVGLTIQRQLRIGHSPERAIFKLQRVALDCA